MIIKKFQGTDAQLYALVAPLVMDVAVIRKNNNYPFKTSDNHLWFVALDEGKVIGFMPVENRLNKMYIDNYYVEEDSEKLLTAFIEKAIEEFAHDSFPSKAERLKKVYPQIEILLGIEANLLNLNGELDMTEEDFKNFDYCIFGVHYFTFGKGVKGSFKFNMHNILMKSTKKYIDKVTDSYIKAIEKYPVKVVVHPNYAVPVNVKRLAEAAAKKGVLIEFNGKRTKFTDEQAQDLINSNAKFIIGSDAHRPERIAECSIPRQFIEKYNIPLDRIVNIDILGN